MPLFPAFLRLVLKAEGIRSNPNFPPPRSLPNVPWLVKSGLPGRTGKGGGRKNWQAEVGDCLSDLVIPLRGSHQASHDMSRPRPRPTWAPCRGLDSAKGKSVYNCLIWSHSVCIPGVACYMKSDCAKAFPFLSVRTTSAIFYQIFFLFAPAVKLKRFGTKISLSPRGLQLQLNFPYFHIFSS